MWTCNYQTKWRGSVANGNFQIYYDYRMRMRVGSTYYCSSSAVVLQRAKGLVRRAYPKFNKGEYTAVVLQYFFYISSNTVLLQYYCSTSTSVLLFYYGSTEVVQ